MQSAPKTVQTPKSYFITRRVDGHSDWITAFWRELFQNSVDAGSKKISIKINDASPKGSFGRPATMTNAIRVQFEDDGCGMDMDTLENVFFSLGQSTKNKDGASIGGFGTARLMLCFSQGRYSIRTRDLIVEGNGSEYTCRTLADEISEVKSALRVAGDQDDTKSALLAERLSELEAFPAYVDGCIFEIDIDPNEPVRDWDKASQSRLRTALARYLSKSDISCKVEIDDGTTPVPTKKRKVVGTLEVSDDFDQNQAFGTIHTSKGKGALHKGEVLVRANGTLMYSHDIQDSGVQVIIEINPEMVREVLTENRDSMKEPYRGVVNEFLNKLAVDNHSTLKEKEDSKYQLVRGGRGSISARKGLLELSFGPDGAYADNGEGKSAEAVLGESLEANVARGATFAFKEERYDKYGFGRVPKAVMDAFLQRVLDGEETFLARYPDREEVAAFKKSVHDIGFVALARTMPALRNFIERTIQTRMEALNFNAEGIEDERMADMHDVHIYSRGISSADKQMKNAIRRHSPGYWRRKGQHLEGRGMQAHMLLAAWTACCNQAIKALLHVRPNIKGGDDFRFSTGWHFEKAQMVWDKTVGDYADKRTGASHVERDGRHVLLLNPVKDDGSVAFDLTKDRRKSDDPNDLMGIQDLEALAMHEVAHIIGNLHDESFANVLTSIVMVFDRAAAREEMKMAVDAVRGAYGRGRTRIQSFDDQETTSVLDADDEPGKKAAAALPRPAERLLAHAAPATTMMSGLAASPENAEVPQDELQQSIASVLSMPEPGVLEVDCDKLAKLEKDVTKVVKSAAKAKKSQIRKDQTKAPQIEEEDAVVISKDGPAKQLLIPDEGTDVFDAVDADPGLDEFTSIFASLKTAKIDDEEPEPLDVLDDSADIFARLATDSTVDTSPSTSMGADEIDDFSLDDFAEAPAPNRM
ncbi:Histidine kinase-, DNA gyrase B-, and HSP90-like ATPase [Thalassospira xiamenensis]|uniref:Histidine kinase-, DNA gyrase B-, and HSP90-like ATPase n=2 Tax=Thalassospira xiamenensis TaxID=220697 RepID=A0A285TSU6_9PROT|nr:Histidine kinase-, DNA gyrase B-, and HSP90-like ATPase [Thalassospira xiamenensis]